MISNVNINYAVYYRKQGRQEETKRQYGNQSIVERLFDKIEISNEAKAASQAPQARQALQTSQAPQTSQATQTPPGSAQKPGGGSGGEPGGGSGGEPGSGGFIYKPADSEPGFMLTQSADDDLKKHLAR